jgi:hypothetical protein
VFKEVYARKSSAPDAAGVPTAVRATLPTDEPVPVPVAEPVMEEFIEETEDGLEVELDESN